MSETADIWRYRSWTGLYSVALDAILTYQRPIRAHIESMKDYTLRTVQEARKAAEAACKEHVALFMKGHMKGVNRLLQEAEFIRYTPGKWTIRVRGEVYEVGNRFPERA